MPNGFITKRPDPQKAKQEKQTVQRGTYSTGYERQHGNMVGNDSVNGLNSAAINPVVTGVPEVRVDDHARHPLGKQWTTKSRGTLKTMHTD